MSYCNVWAEVVFCGFPKKDTNLTMPIFCASANSHLTKFQMLVYSG